MNVTNVEIGDIEGDGFPDILTFNRSSEFSVLWNQGEGRSLRAEDFRGYQRKSNPPPLRFGFLFLRQKDA